MRVPADASPIVLDERELAALVAGMGLRWDLPLCVDLGDWLRGCLAYPADLGGILLDCYDEPGESRHGLVLFGAKCGWSPTTTAVAVSALGAAAYVGDLLEAERLPPPARRSRTSTWCGTTGRCDLNHAARAE